MRVGLPRQKADAPTVDLVQNVDPVPTADLALTVDLVPSVALVLRAGHVRKAELVPKEHGKAIVAPVLIADPVAVIVVVIVVQRDADPVAIVDVPVAAHVSTGLPWTSRLKGSSPIACISTTRRMPL